MIHCTARDLFKCTFEAVDGQIGKAHDLYIDDQAWITRYLVVDTGRWLSGRKVLIAPEALEAPELQAQVLRARLRKQQIQESPSMDTDKPVSRQHEAELRGYYAWPMYWGDGGDVVYSPTGLSGSPMSPHIVEEPQPTRDLWGAREGDPHLRSARVLLGYDLQATNGPMGRVFDLLVEGEKWRITELIVDIGSWLSGQKIHVSPAHIGRISWRESRIYLNETKENLLQYAASETHL